MERQPSGWVGRLNARLDSGGRRALTWLKPRRWWALVVVIGLVLVCDTAYQGFLAHRFQNHSEIADAEIHDSDHGCIFAAGRPDLPMGPRRHIVYEVSFPTAEGVHRTSVRKPCSVIPPDFGQGRGAIWVEYDTANPDRVRVQSDRSAEIRTEAGWIMMGLLAVGVGSYVLVRYSRRRGRRQQSE